MGFWPTYDTLDTTGGWQGWRVLYRERLPWTSPPYTQQEIPPKRETVIIGYSLTGTPIEGYDWLDMAPPSELARIAMLVLIELFTDARWDGRRGWWADGLSAEPLGSTLWRWYGRPVTDDDLPAIKAEVSRVLQRLVSRGVISSYQVDLGLDGGPERHLTGAITVTRGDTGIRLRWQDLWEAA